MGNKGLSPEFFAGAGLAEIDDFVKVPEEWKAIGYRKVPRKDGKGDHAVVEYTRPNEENIELWSHSMQDRAGVVFVRRDHVERQAEDARKNGKKSK